MLTPPRNLRTERLIDCPLLLYSYVLLALLESLTCVGAFLLYMDSQGFPLSTLLYNRAFWSDPQGDALAAYRGGVATYFFTLVACQSLVHIYSAKTLRQSLLTFPTLRNPLTNCGAVVAVGVVVVVAYLLGGSVFSTGPFPFWVSWTLFLAFAVCFLPLMEAIKACARRGLVRFP